MDTELMFNNNNNKDRILQSQNSVQLETDFIKHHRDKINATKI